MRASHLGKRVCLGFMGLLLLSTVRSQEVAVDLGADIVSSYVWRGVKQAGASIQPSLSLSIDGFSIGAWGSTDIASFGSKEVDFSASYTTGGFKVALTDYWYDGEGVYNYLGRTGTASHSLEGSLSYTFPESFPLTLSWNTFFLGEYDKKIGDDGKKKSTYSTFIEAAYPFQIGGVDMNASIGIFPWEAHVYGVSDFEVATLQVGASKEIKITESYSLPVYGSVIASPATDDIHFVFGIKLF